jgi:hypothetical protein
MSDEGFLKRMMTFDPIISPETMNRILEYTSSEDFNLKKIDETSQVCAVFCRWVKAIEDYNLAILLTNTNQETLKELANSFQAKIANL